MVSPSWDDRDRKGRGTTLHVDLFVQESCARMQFLLDTLRRNREGREMLGEDAREEPETRRANFDMLQ